MDGPAGSGDQRRMLHLRVVKSATVFCCVSQICLRIEQNEIEETGAFYVA